MHGCAIGKREIALMYDRDELAQLGIGTDLRKEDALHLIRDALTEGGEKWTDLEVDVFISPKALLLIGRKPEMQEYCFAFADAEALIGGCCSAGDGERSELYLYNDRLHLLVHTDDESNIVPLRAFALSENEHCIAFIREHGKAILTENALETIRKSFKKTVS